MKIIHHKCILLKHDNLLSKKTETMSILSPFVVLYSNINEKKCCENCIAKIMNCLVINSVAFFYSNYICLRNLTKPVFCIFRTAFRAAG